MREEEGGQRRRRRWPAGGSNWREANAHRPAHSFPVYARRRRAGLLRKGALTEVRAGQSSHQTQRAGILRGAGVLTWTIRRVRPDTAGTGVQKARRAPSGAARRRGLPAGGGGGGGGGGEIRARRAPRAAEISLRWRTKWRQALAAASWPISAHEMQALVCPRGRLAIAAAHHAPSVSHSATPTCATLGHLRAHRRMPLARCTPPRGSYKSGQSAYRFAQRAQPGLVRITRAQQSCSPRLH